MNIPIWQAEYLEPSLAVALVTLGFSIYHFVSISDKVKLRYQNKYGDLKGNTKFLWMTRYLGCMTIGVIPFFLMLLMLDKRPSLKERSSTSERLKNKIVDFVETYITGVAV